MQAQLATNARRIAAALTYRDFRLLWFGALTSSIGTWMQKVAQAWLIVTLTGSQSAFYLGLDSFLGELPILLLTLVAGVVADRRDRRHMMLMSQVVQMAVAFTLAGLVFFDTIQIWHILLLSCISGCAQAFGGPAYQSLVPTLVGKEHLPNAIALNSIQFNLARIIGPIVAGVALATFGMVMCFGMNGISFLFVIAAILSLRDVHVPPASSVSIVSQMKDGLRYVHASPNLRTLTMLGFIAAFLGLPLLTFLPIIAKDVFQQDVGLYTQMMTTSGVGAVCGALFVAWLGKHQHLGRILLVLLSAFGCDDDGVRAVARGVAEHDDSVLHGRAAGDVLLGHQLARAAHRPARAARTDRQHLHDGVPWRLTARRAGERLADHAGGVGAGDAGGERRGAGRARRVPPGARARDQGRLERQTADGNRQTADDEEQGAPSARRSGQGAAFGPEGVRVCSRRPSRTVTQSASYGAKRCLLSYGPKGRLSQGFSGTVNRTGTFVGG